MRGNAVKDFKVHHGLVWVGVGSSALSRRDFKRLAGGKRSATSGNGTNEIIDPEGGRSVQSCDRLRGRVSSNEMSPRVRCATRG